MHYSLGTVQYQAQSFQTLLSFFVSSNVGRRSTYDEGVQSCYVRTVLDAEPQV